MSSPCSCSLLSKAVAYTPSINWASRDIGGLAARIKIPILVLAGEADRYNNCCLIEHMRELDAAARAQQLPLELVVYATTDHGFNLWGRAYRSDVTEDAWRRTKEMLARHLPLQ